MDDFSVQASSSNTPSGKPSASGTSSNGSSGADRTGVTVVGARLAGSAAGTASGNVVSSPQWSDEADSVPNGPDEGSDLDSFDPGWMVAGDATLGDLLGIVPPGSSEALKSAQPDARTPQLATPPTKDTTEGETSSVVDLAAAEKAHAAAKAESKSVGTQATATQATATQATVTQASGPVAGDGVASDADDVFPDEMYRLVPGFEIEEDSRSEGGTPESEEERRTNQADRRLLERRTDVPGGSTPAPSRRKAATQGVDEGSEEWSAFAGSAPRWRDEASDWADVDTEDPSQLGDDRTMVGTLNPLRSERSDLYGDVDLNGAVGSGGAVAQGGDSFGGVKPVDSAVTGPAVKVLTFDGLVENREVKGRSGGSQQREGARKAGSTVTNEADSVQGVARPRPRKSSKAAAPSSLGARVGTALLLVVVCSVVCIFLKEIGAAVLVALAVPMASLELMQALRSRGFKPAMAPVALGLAGTVGAAMWRGERGVLVVSAVTVMSVLLWFLFGAERERPAVNVAASLMAFGYLGTAAATAALLLDAPKGLGLLVGAIVCTIAHDVFAYFGGRVLGNHKLAPHISPNKTVEGLVIGVLGAIGAGVVFARLGWTWNGTAQGVALGLVVGLAAPLGDLVESQLKRDLRIKDSGTLLPGHGGVLDRIDAMLFAVPAAWLVAIAFGHL